MSRCRFTSTITGVSSSLNTESLIRTSSQVGCYVCIRYLGRRESRTRITSFLLAFTCLPLGFKSSILGGFLVCRLFPIPELSPFSSINVYFVVVLITIPFNNYYGFL